mgnify:FL=1
MVDKLLLLIHELLGFEVQWLLGHGPSLLFETD